MKNALEQWAVDGGAPRGEDSTPEEAVYESNPIAETILHALNQQVQHEQSNAHAYHAVSLYFRREDLRGLEAYMARQAEEERAHAEKFIQHVSDRGGRVELGTINAPNADFGSALDAARHVRHLEIKTSQTIHRLYEHACNESDYALQVLLHGFITEQVEEEKWSQELMVGLQRFHEHPDQLLLLDQQWGDRAKA